MAFGGSTEESVCNKNGHKHTRQNSWKRRQMIDTQIVAESETELSLNRDQIGVQRMILIFIVFKQHIIQTD